MFVGNIVACSGQGWLYLLIRYRVARGVPCRMSLLTVIVFEFILLTLV